MPSNDDILRALMGQTQSSLPPNAMQALMGQVPVLQGGNVMPSPIGPGPASPELYRVIGGASPEQLRAAVAPTALMSQKPDPMQMMLGLGGGPGGPATAMAMAPRVGGGRARDLNLDARGHNFFGDNFGAKPKHIIQTGYGSEYATELQIHHQLGRDGNVARTYVVPAGEFQNSEPYYFNGEVSPKNVLNHYKQSIKEGEEP